jgi:hypothetical protein
MSGEADSPVDAQLHGPSLTLLRNGFYLWRLPYFFQIAYFSARQTAQGL